MSDFAELRDKAKSLGINTFQMSKGDIVAAIEKVEGLGLNAESVKKKGRNSWRWRNRLDVNNKDPRFRYRFVSRDESNLREKQEDGWGFVNPLSGVPGEHVDPKQVSDGVPIDGAMTYRDMVLMAIPEELAQQRDAAVAERTRAQTVNLKHRLQSDLRNPDGSGAEVHGNITIIE